MDREIEASDMSALEAVLTADEERGRIEAQADALTELLTEGDLDDDEMAGVNETLKASTKSWMLDAATAEAAGHPHRVAVYC